MNVPENLRFTEEHEWIRMDGDIAYIGITAHAADQLGELVYLEVETVGETLAKGDCFGVVEASKAASDLYLPISGEVLEMNEELADDNCKIINEDAYDKGWIIKLKPSDPSEIEELLTADQYKDLIA